MASAYDGSSPILLDITLLFGLFALVVFIQVVTRPRRYHRLDDQLDDQQVEAYIGLGGIYFAGVYVPVTGLRFHLTAASVEVGDPTVPCLTWSTPRPIFEWT